MTFRDADTAITVPTGPDMEPVYRLRRFLSADGTRRTPMLVGATDLSWTTTIALPPGVAGAPAARPTSTSQHRGRALHRALRRDGARRSGRSRNLVIDRDVFQPDEIPGWNACSTRRSTTPARTLTLSRAEADADLGAGRSGGELAAGK